MSSTLLANSTIDIKGALDTYATQQPVETNITPVIADVVNAVIIIAALLFLVYLLLGAIGWVTAGGDKGKIESAREKIIQGFIGLAVAVFAYAFYLFVIDYLGIGLSQGNGVIERGGGSGNGNLPRDWGKNPPNVPRLGTGGGGGAKN